MQFPPLVLAAAVAAVGVDAAVPALITRAEQLAPPALTTGGQWNATKTAYITQTVTGYVTYCPTATKFAEGTKTFTVTKEEWVTVDCGHCTISNQAGANPTVVPIGVFPKYNNHTAPVPVCPETGKPGSSCPPFTNGTTGGNGAPGAGSNTGAPGSGSSSGVPGSGSSSGAPGSGSSSGVPGSGSSSGAPGSGSSSGSPASGSDNVGPASGEGNGADSGSNFGNTSTTGVGSEGPTTFTGAASTIAVSTAALAAVAAACAFLL